MEKRLELVIAANGGHIENKYNISFDNIKSMKIFFLNGISLVKKR